MWVICIINKKFLRVLCIWDCKKFIKSNQVSFYARKLYVRAWKLHDSWSNNLSVNIRSSYNIRNSAWSTLDILRNLYMHRLIKCEKIFLQKKFYMAKIALFLAINMRFRIRLSFSINTYLYKNWNIYSYWIA